MIWTKPPWWNVPAVNLPGCISTLQPFEIFRTKKFQVLKNQYQWIAMSQVHLPKPVVRLQPKKLPYIIPRVGNKKAWEKTHSKLCSCNYGFWLGEETKQFFRFCNKVDPQLRIMSCRYLQSECIHEPNKWCRQSLAMMERTWIIRSIRGLLGFCLGVLRFALRGASHGSAVPVRTGCPVHMPQPEAAYIATWRMSLGPFGHLGDPKKHYLAC